MFRTKHDFQRGTTLPPTSAMRERDAAEGPCIPRATELATCFACGTLRVSAGDVTHFIRRAVPEEDRIRDEPPPCVDPPLHFRAPW